MKLHHSYQTLPSCFWQPATPDIAPQPSLVIFNEALAQSLGIVSDITNNTVSDDNIIDWFSGKSLPADAQPIAQAYAGHQFGQLNRLGDGRATLLGEVQTDHGVFDIQLKGSGRTPYSRQGDGKANLGPMLREYIMSEAMHALGIATTRSLAVIETGEPVRRREHRKGAVLARVASSHIRVGTFVHAMIAAHEQQDFTILESLLDYTLARHYPELQSSDNKAIALLDAVISRQAQLVVDWQRVGFVHGVLNTDNITISGETIDYGPCAFMDSYDENSVFSSIDRDGRYAFGNQPPIMQWNMARFAESLLPLIDDDQSKAIELASQSLDNFQTTYHQLWQKTLSAKLGISSNHNDIAIKLLDIMQNNVMDYTNTFVYLTQLAMGETSPSNHAPNDTELLTWIDEWKPLLNDSSVDLMQSHNPIVIPRNHLVEKALDRAGQGNLESFYQLNAILQDPYAWDRIKTLSDYQKPADTKWTENYQTFCGT